MIWQISSNNLIKMAMVFYQEMSLLMLTGQLEVLTSVKKKLMI